MSESEPHGLQREFDARLSQEAQTFERLLEKDRASFKLHMAMGWTAFALLPMIAAGAFYVLARHDQFDKAVTTVAAGMLFVETVALVATIWRIFVGDGPGRLEPVTHRPAAEEETPVADWRRPA